jgi:hypothetical protein
MAVLGVDLNPDRRRLGQFAAIFFVSFGLIGVWALKKWGSLPTACALWAGALVTGIAGLIRPPLVRPIYLTMAIVTLPIGWAISEMLLVAAYYGFLTPLGLALRVFGRDQMKRRFDKEAKSYWISRQPAVSTERYFRQF